MLLNENHYRLILAMADCDMKVTKAIKEAGLGQTAGYRYLDEIATATGLDPRCFWDLVDLQEFAVKVVVQRQEFAVKNVAQHQKK